MDSATTNGPGAPIHKRMDIKYARRTVARDDVMELCATIDRLEQLIQWAQSQITSADVNNEINTRLFMILR